MLIMSDIGKLGSQTAPEALQTLINAFLDKAINKATLLIESGLLINIS